MKLIIPIVWTYIKNLPIPRYVENNILKSSVRGDTKGQIGENKKYQNSSYGY